MPDQFEFLENLINSISFESFLNKIKIELPGWTSRTSNILSTWLLYAVIWNTHSGESCMQVIFTGTKSSETCCHFTVPAPLADTWNTSAHNLKTLLN